MFQELLQSVKESTTIGEGVASAKKLYVDTDKVARWAFNIIVKTDPTPTKKYVEWMCKKYMFGAYLEDFEESIPVFDRAVKRGLIKNKDINTYTMTDFLKTVAELEKLVTKSELKNIHKRQTEKVYEDDNFLVVSPQSEEAACYYGKSTKWCTTSKRENYFLGYILDGVKIYYIIKKSTQQKWAVAVEPDRSIQFFDSKDNLLTSSRTDFTRFILRNWTIPVDIFVPYTKEERERLKELEKLVVH